jgi:hypothetical protein
MMMQLLGESVAVAVQCGFAVIPDAAACAYYAFLACVGSLVVWRIR